MPTPKVITLSDAERIQLEKNLRSRTTPIRLVVRSNIILRSADGESNIFIAEQLGVGINTVARWRNRFAQFGLKGIEKELPRGANHGGKKTEEQAKLRTKIIEITTQEKPLNATHWSTRSLAKRLNINQSFVGRVWQENGLKPHLSQQFKISNDPQFEEKLHDVVGLLTSAHP